MLKFRNSLAALLGVLALAGAIALVTPRTTQGQKANTPTAQPSPLPPPLNVKVINTESEPVPVTGTVSVSNLGGSPLPVRDVDNPARRPFVKGVDLLVEPGPSGSFANIPFNLMIPAGSRLVIERVSGIVRVPAGQVVTGSVRVTTDGEELPHDLRFTFEGSTIGLLAGDRFVTAESLRLYADAGTDIIASIVRNSSTGVGQGRMIISGYFVDVPPEAP